MNFDRLDLNLIKIFDSLYREKTLTRVAKIMGLSQPAISHSLAKLREFFDDPLFVREKNIMVPTAKAERIHGRMGRSLERLRHAVEDRGHSDPTRSSRAFMLGLTNYTGVVVLPRLLAALEQQAPMIRVFTRHAGAGQKADFLEEGSIDLAIGCSPINRSGLKQQRLFDDQEVCIAGRSTRVPEHAITPDNISRYSLIRLQVAQHETTDIFQHLDKEKIDIKTTFTTDQETLIPLIVAGSNHIGIVANKIARVYQKAFGFDIYPVRGLDTRFTARQYWHSRNDKDPVHQWFRRLVKTVCAQEGWPDESSKADHADII